MERRHEFAQLCAQRGLIRLRDGAQQHEIFLKGSGIKGDLVADVDQIVLCLLHPLAAEQQLLIELLTRAQAGIDDGNIDIRLKTGQSDHIARQIVDAHGLAHVEHEDLAAAGIRARLKNELHSLGDGHEIADDAIVRDRDGAAAADLLAKKRDNAAGRTEDVAEAHGDILRCRAVVHHLHDHLAQALGRAHDVRGVDGLVRRDEDKALRAEAIRRLRDVVRAEDVILDRLKRRRLHERHVLMRRRVAHEIRPVTVKDLHDALTVAHGADEHDQIQLRMRAPQLHLDVVGVILVDIENDEPFRPLCRRLTAELAADAAAAARDEHGLAGDVGRDLIEVDLHRLAAKQVLNVHLADLLDAHLAVGELADAGQCAQGAGCVVAVTEDLQLLLPGGRRDGKDDLVNVVLFRHRGDAAAAADDLHAAQIAADLVRRIVNDAHDLVFRARAGLKLAQRDGAGLTAANEHGALFTLRACGARSGRTSAAPRTAGTK